jgi:tetratricopeptide (TPR) repeat protein
MMATQPGTALVSAEVRRAAGLDFDWGEVRHLRLAGKSGEIEASPLIGRRRRSVVRTPADGSAASFVGRDPELAALQTHAAEVLAGRGRVVVITGPAGVGKSRLLADLELRLAEQGVRVRAGAAPSYGARTSYAVWQDLCRDAWGIDADATVEAVVARLELVLSAVDEQLLPRLPLLGPLLGVVIPDTPLTASFDAKLRKTSVESLVIQLFEANAARGPIAFLIDAAEHLDELSWDLVEAIGRLASRVSILILIARRPTTTDEELSLLSLEHVDELALAPLDADSSRRLVADRLQARGARPLSDAAVDRLTTLAAGNPFHLEELVNHVTDRGVDPAAEDISLPTSLHSLELARIDDLAESPRRTLKVASVIGERFDITVVAGTYPDLGTEAQVGTYTLVLSDASLVVQEADSAYSFTFRNITTQQVAYETLTFGSRAALHDGVVAWLEARTEGDPAAILDVLAHHAGRGTDVAKKRRYLVEAGEAAQSRYANEAAVRYFTSALEIVDADERAELYRRLGKVLEVLGRWPEAYAAYEHAIEIYDQRGDEGGRAQARTDLAEVLRKQGRFDEAQQLLRAADDAFAALGDRAGLATVLHLQGTLASQQSHYDEGRAAYEASLAIRQSLGDAPKIGALLSNLAVVAEQVGDYAEARELNERALAVRQEVGDPWAIAVSQNNLGMIALLQEDYPRATEHIAASMRLAEQVGDRWIVAVGQHNYGNAQRGRAEYAASGAAFLAAQQAYLDHDDRWSMALLVEDVIFLAVDTGQDREAVDLLGAADALRDALDAPRSPAPAALTDAALAPVRDRLGAAADIEYAAGRRLAAAELAELVRRVCSRPAA